MNLDNLFLAEYSHSQNKFHCDYLKVSIKRNIETCLNNQPNDWITIGIFKTWEESQDFINNFSQKQISNVDKSQFE